jgi:hypothetical protein
VYVQPVLILVPESFLIPFLLFAASLRTSELPHFSPGRSVSNAQYRAGNVHGSIHFAVATESNNAVSTSEAPGFIPKDPVQLRFAPGASNPRLVHEKPEEKVGCNLETA